MDASRALALSFSAMIGFNPACASVAAASSTDEVVVAATRAPRLASEVGSSITVIDAATIAERQYQLASDALRDTPGVTIARNGGAGAFSGVRIRGVPGGGVLVVIDGVVVNDPAAPSGGFNFATLDLADVDRIEILRGPQSMLYGADAMGGVVAITTKKSGRAGQVEVGAYGTARAAATIAGEGRRAFGRLSVSGATSDGFSRAAAGTEADGFESLAVSFRGGIALDARWRLETTARLSRARADFDGFPPPDYQLADAPNVEKTQEALVAARVISGDDEDRFSHTVAASWSAIDRRSFEAGARSFDADGERMSLEYLARWRPASGIGVLAGAQIDRSKAEVAGIDDRTKGASAFVLVEAAPVAGVALSAGVRRDEFADFEGATTTRFAAAVTMPGGGALRASVGEGYRAPTVFQLHFNLFGLEPNPDLRPERSWAFDIGYEQNLSSTLSVRATYFHQDIRDLIDFDFASGGYVNIGAVRSQGVEAEIAWRPAPFLTASANYTLTDAKDRDTSSPLPRQPRHQGAAAVSLIPFKRVELGASLIVNGAEPDFPTDNAAFLRLDLRGAVKLSPGVQIYGRIENVGDAQYQDVSGFGESGRSAYGGIRMAM